MTKRYTNIVNTVQDAVKEANRRIPYKASNTLIQEVKEYTPEEIRNIRINAGMSQKVFAGWLGVSEKTVEAWEGGTKNPSGSACRLLQMLETDAEIITRYSFITLKNKQ